MKKMLGTKIFLILCLFVHSYSRPQPEFKIIIHFHPEPYQPPPARGGPVGVGRIDDNDYRPGGVIDSPPAAPQLTPPPVERRSMDAYQPGPVRCESGVRGGVPYNRAINRSPWAERRRMGGAPLARESGFDYSDGEYFKATRVISIVSKPISIVVVVVVIVVVVYVKKS